MGALPKRRISTARRGKRRAFKLVDTKQVKHSFVGNHKIGLVEQIKKLFVTND